MNFDDLNIRKTFFCFVFLNAFFNLASVNSEFPSKSMLFTLTFVPLSILITMLTLLFVLSGIVFMATLVL